VTERGAFDDAFAALPFERQLKEFLADVERPPQTYPSWLARRIKERIGDLPSEVRQALLWRVRGRRRGPWRQLKRRLAALECERQGKDFAWPWDTGGRGSTPHQKTP
jgi:hypothetical protein